MNLRKLVVIIDVILCLIFNFHRVVLQNTLLCSSFLSRSPLNYVTVNISLESDHPDYEYSQFSQQMCSHLPNTVVNITRMKKFSLSNTVRTLAKCSIFFNI